MKKQFDIESTPAFLKGKQPVVADGALAEQRDGCLRIRAQIATPLGFVLYDGLKFETPEQMHLDSSTFRFIWNGRLYQGMANVFLNRKNGREAAAKFAKACTKLKSQNVYGAKGILPCR